MPDRLVTKIAALGLISALAFTLTACGGSATGGEIKIQGAGATFPYPLYQK